VFFAGKVLNSPTLMTWMSLITKSLAFFLVMPLIVTRFSTSDVALWYLFVSALSFQLIADLGFSSTLIRMFSFASGGLSVSEIENIHIVNNCELKVQSILNVRTLEITWQVMNFIYQRLSLIFFAFISVSSYFLYNPIQKSSNPTNSFVAWSVIIVTSFLQLRYSTYSNYLQGINKVALVKRWEAVLNIFAILSNALVLYLGGGLLALVVSTQFWAMITLLRDYFLCKAVEDGLINQLDVKAKKVKAMFDIVWPSAWKSGLGILMSVGLLQITNMIFAKDGKSAEVASYLLGYSLIRQISSFAQAPFYSRIPLLAKLRGEKDINNLVVVAQKGMRLTYWCFTLLMISIGIVGKFGLPYIKSNVNFPSTFLWSSIGLGILFERFGAMHIQLHSTTNKIIWHKANGITGLIFILTFFLGKSYLGLFIFPIALIVSNVSFYAWYCALNSYRSVNMSFMDFERRGFIIPLLVYLTYTAISAFS